MDTWLVASGLLLAVIAAIHSALGERAILGPLLAYPHSEGPLAENRRVRKILRGAWHVTSVTWLGTGAMVFALAFTPLDQGARVVITLAVIIYGAIGLYLLVAFKGRHIGAPFFVAVAITAAVPLF